jgi:hypothetical protein
MRRKRGQKSRLSENDDSALKDKDDSPTKENSKSSLNSPLKENSSNSNSEFNSPHKISNVENSQQMSNNNLDTGDLTHNGKIDIDTASPVNNCDSVVSRNKFSSGNETGDKQNEEKSSHDSGTERRNSYETRSRHKNCSIEIIIQPKKSPAEPSKFNGSPLKNGSPTMSTIVTNSSPHKVGAISSSSPNKAGSEASPIRSSGATVKEITFEHSLLDEYHSLSALRQKQRPCAVGPTPPSPPSSPHRSTKQAALLQPADKESTLQEVLRRLGTVRTVKLIDGVMACL